MSSYREKKYFCAKKCLEDFPINQRGFPICFLSLNKNDPTENNHLSLETGE